eukprot:1371244-Amphidinium_carterae.1
MSAPHVQAHLMFRHLLCLSEECNAYKALGHMQFGGDVGPMEVTVETSGAPIGTPCRVSQRGGAEGHHTTRHGSSSTTGAVAALWATVS